ncbi:Uncharacterised protein [uncultured archaeon]|nr:Uncharacterised protein [uncultured archaeon]
MVSEAKTLIILDTNKIRNNFEWEKDYSDFEPKGDFLKLIEWIEKNKLTELVFIGLPEIVIEELVNTRCENFFKQFEELKTGIKKLGNIPSFNFSKTILPVDNYDYYAFIKQKLIKYVETKKFVIILKLERKLYEPTLELLMEKATKKKKPFNESKGFKDALIWEIILNFKNIDDYFSIFVLSENERDFDSDLQKEFKKKFMKNLNLEFNTNLLISSLETIYGVHIKYPILVSYLKTGYFKEKLIDFLERSDLEIKNFEVKTILDISEMTSADLEEFDLTDVYSEEDLINLKKTNILFENNSKEFNAKIIFETEDNEIVNLIYEEKEVLHE